MHLLFHLVYTNCVCMYFLNLLLASDNGLVCIFILLDLSATFDKEVTKTFYWD